MVIKLGTKNDICVNADPAYKIDKHIKDFNNPHKTSYDNIEGEKPFYTKGQTDTVFSQKSNATNLLNGSSLGSLRTVGAVAESPTYKMGKQAFAEGYMTQASGSCSHAEGNVTIASGARSHAEGDRTTASGETSHTEGYLTVASGSKSHAEGHSTEASGDYAHAEGQYTKAIGVNAHAEGYDTDAIGNYSHAEGQRTKSSGGFSHAEGYLTIADGANAHAEGESTQAKKNSTHAEGRFTIADAESAHAEGSNTQATGTSSHAEGNTSKATGAQSHAEGWSSQATGAQSHAEGGSTTAGGESSHAEGQGTQATGTNSHAEGRGTVASNYTSHSEGEFSQAKGRISHAEGFSTRAEGECSHAEGSNTQATGARSHSAGENSKAIGNNSVAEGRETQADGTLHHVLGRFNILTGASPTDYSATAEAFTIGNGSSTSRGNAFKILFNGNTYSDGAFNSTGADYAEMFEWVDRNENNEDRIGYFVTLDGVNIRKALSTDDYILGVVSGTASVIGDSYEDRWNGKYMTDEWGRYIYEDVAVPEITDNIEHPEVIIPMIKYDEEGNVVLNDGIPVVEDTVIEKAWTETVIIQSAGMEKQIKLNPNFNPDTSYVSRNSRPEWSCVGVIGKLYVRDDGTCFANGYCISNDSGIATKSEKGYRVLERISDNIIRIWFK